MKILTEKRKQREKRKHCELKRLNVITQSDVETGCAPFPTKGSSDQT